MILKQVNQNFILIVKELLTKVPMKYVLCRIILKIYIGNDAKELYLFSDGWAGQSRNHAMVRVLLSLVDEQGSNINEMQYYQGVLTFWEFKTIWEFRLYRGIPNWGIPRYRRQK